MAVIDFIRQDAKRGGGGRAIAIGCLVAAGAAAAGLWLGWRDDYAGAVNARTVWPAVAMALSLAAVPWCVRRGHGLAVAALGALVLAVSLLSPTLPDSITRFEAPWVFWWEAGKCLFKGTVVGWLLGAAAIFAWLRWLPLPDRFARQALAGWSGLAGVLILELHCSKTAPSHLIVAHWGQALLVFGPLFAGFNALSARRVRRVLGGAAESLQKLDHF